MADIQTDFYPKAPTNNLADTLSTIQGIKNAQETNKLLQGQQTQQNVAIDQAKLNLAHQQYGILSGALGTLAQDPRIATPDGHALLQATTKQLVQNGIIPQNVADTELANAPQDPAQLPQYLQTLNTRVLDGQQKFSAIYGSPGTLTNGSQTLPVTTSPITGIRPIGAPIDHTLSPETRADLVPTTDPQGRQVMVPKGNLLSQAGVDPMTAQPMAARPAGGNQLTAPAPGAVERRDLPPVQQNPPGGVVTSPSAGTVEAQKVLGQQGGQNYAQDIARERNFQADVIPLQKAYDAIKRLGDTGTGPGTETINDAKSFLVSMGIISPTQNIKDFDEARKYLVQYARGAGDTGTNDKLAAAFAGNPSLGISNAASIDVVKTALSLRRLQNAQTRAFGSTGLAPDQYSKWSTDFNSSQDPVAYGFDMMDGAQRQKYFKGLDQAGKSKFLTSLKTATQLGIISPPQVQ